jgi:hypothetical protein
VGAFHWNLPYVANIDNRSTIVLFRKSPLLRNSRCPTCLLHVTWQARCGHGNHLHVTSYARTRYSQPIERLHVAGYFCIISRLYNHLAIRRGNTSTVTLGVVRDDVKGTQCPGVWLGHPVPGGDKYGNFALQVGGVSDETVKYVFGFWVTRTIEWLHCKSLTRPLVREGAQ